MKNHFKVEVWVMWLLAAIPGVVAFVVGTIKTTTLSHGTGTERRRESMRHDQVSSVRLAQSRAARMSC